MFFTGKQRAKGRALTGGGRPEGINRPGEEQTVFELWPAADGNGDLVGPNLASKEGDSSRGEEQAGFALPAAAVVATGGCARIGSGGAA